MKQSTRSALKLADNATNADAAAVLGSNGHTVSLRALERSDKDLVDYLSKEKPAIYALLYEEQYGKAPVTKAAPVANPAAGQQAKVKLAALGADVTMRQLEKENPALLLQLKHSAPDEYSRLFAATYGPAPGSVATGAAIDLAAPTGEAPAAGQWRLKKGTALVMNMAGEMTPEQLAEWPKIGHDFANDDRFERVE